MLGGHVEDNTLYKIVIAGSTAFLAEMGPIIPMILTLGLLIFVDTVLGVWASIKQKKPIVSPKAERVIIKGFIYIVVVGTLFMVEKHIWNDFFGASRVAASGIAIYECLSILENAGIILGEPVFEKIIKRLGSKNKD